MTVGGRIDLVLNGTIAFTGLLHFSVEADVYCYPFIVQHHVCAIVISDDRHVTVDALEPFEGSRLPVHRVGNHGGCVC